MRAQIAGYKNKFTLVLLFTLLFFSFSHEFFAANSGTSQLLRMLPSPLPSARGDYVSAGDSLNTYYRFFIEVPAGQSTLRVGVYDSDIGYGANHDEVTGNATTWCNYSVYRPNGTLYRSYTVGNTSGVNGPGVDAGWDTIATVSNPTAGHWELRIDMSSTYNVGTDDDEVNGFAIRADDGNETSGGTEFNIYAQSYIPLGHSGIDHSGPQPGATTFALYPWITQGCTTNFRDFDGDSQCTIDYADRTGTTSGSFSGSGATTMKTTPISFETNDYFSIDSGIWTAGAQYTGLSSSPYSNFGTFRVNDSANTNPFRIYLPTDGGGMPAKPYLTQRLSFVEGSNPPTRNNTTVVKVIIEFTNPSAHAIGSNANTVTAYVPGGQVTYRGSAYASVSQGLITSQPAAGGSGTVSWSPGTIAAGTTATLTYEISVTPTSTGLLVVTGSSTTANGTRATFSDETGTLYTYGSPCGLAVTAGSGQEIPTWSGISRFGACADEGIPTVEWHTSTEIGVVGFHLWRLDYKTQQYERVNEDLLSTLPSSHGGGIYRFIDPGDVYGQAQVYRLEEVDAQGRSLMYGPFTVDFAAASRNSTREPEVRLGRELPSQVDGFRRFERERSELEQQRLVSRAQERQLAMLQKRRDADRLRITVKGKGLFYVSAAQVAAGLGMSDSQAAGLISRYNLNLTGLGKDIAWLAAVDGSGLYFYNPGIETIFYDKNVYFLERGRGLAMDTLHTNNAGQAQDNSVYRETIHYEINQYAATALFKTATDDIWLWDSIRAGKGAKVFPLHVPVPAGSGNAVLTIALHGATDTTADPDHHALVSINGEHVAEAVWSGAKAHVFEATFDASLLQEGVNAIAVSGSLDTGAPYSTFFVESFDLAYPRHYTAENNFLICRADGNAEITVSGITDQQVLVLDVSEPERPLQLTGIIPDVAGRIGFFANNMDGTFVVSGASAALAPLAVEGSREPHIMGQARSAEHIVIAPAEFAQTAQDLVDFRQSRGLRSVLVTLEDIYDTYNHGIPNPYAIRKFLSDAYGKGRNSRLKYVVMAGKGTYDYNNYTGYGDNLVPVILASTQHGLFAADGIFGDVHGTDGLPEIAVGRLPAVTNAELKAMIDKIKAYERGSGQWTSRGLFIADNNDDGGDFTGGSERLDALARGVQTEKVYHTGSIAETRSKITSAWSNGIALVNYCGHAGLTNLAQENFFDVNDAMALSNGEKLPLAVILTCIAGRFEIPGLTSLAEALMLNADGGMAGGLVPSGLAMHTDSMQFGELFYNSIYQNLEDTSGKAMLSAMQKFLQKSGSAYILSVFNWLGDPATPFK